MPIQTPICDFGQKALPPKIATLFNIPLVFYGENEAEYGNPIGDTNSSKRDSSYFSEGNKSDISLGGVPIEELKDKFGLNQNDLDPYLPIDPEKIEKNNIKELSFFVFEKKS